MFVSDHHLPNLLSAESYTSQEHYQREIESYFLPAWHCVGTHDEFAKDGDYRTVELFDHPLIIWRVGESYKCFLNVCSHRFCRLTNKASGHFRERLQCQYHGWEYDTTGNTRKIPDATSFRPLKNGTLGLTQFRCESAGQLIWVTLDDNAPSLEEYLGSLYPRCQQWFGDDSRLVITDDDFGPLAKHPCNWKVILENVLESYHVDMVHPTTFKKFNPEYQCDHRFEKYSDHLEVDYSENGDRTQWLASKLIGTPIDYTWHHLCRYPNTVFGQLAFFHFVQAAVPIGPEQTWFFTRVVVDPGQKGTLRSKMAFQGLKRWARRWFPAVNREDAAIFAEVQKGTRSPRLPKGGLVSRREERIFAFQNYVLGNETD